MDIICLKRRVSLTDVRPEPVQALIGRIADLHRDKHEWIQLDITCTGGHVLTGLGLYDFLRYISSTGSEIQTVGYGVVHSMAIPIFLAGDRRIITPSTAMRLHGNGEFMQARVYLTQELQAITEQIVEEEKRYIGLLVERTGGKLRADEALSLMRADTYLTAKELLRYGIAHKVLGINTRGE